MKNLLIAFCFVLAQYQSGYTQETKKSTTEIFDSFIGNWVAPDTSSIYKTNPSRKGKIFFSFEKGSYEGFLMVKENFTPGKEDAIFTGIVCINPVTGNYELFGSNSQDNFLFKGFYEDITPTSFTRHYEVYYPKDHPMAQNAGQVLAFKETFELTDANTIMFDVKFYSKKDRVWKDWIQGRHVLVRKNN